MHSQSKKCPWAFLLCKKLLMVLKKLLKTGLSKLNIDLTRNMQYDRLTLRIMQQTLKANSNCIDIGCFKGEVLERMVKLAPGGTHYAFEPIPAFYNDLKKRFNGKVKIFPFALSEFSGTANFKFVKNAPAYSGLKSRKYDLKNPEIEDIRVEIKKLDELIPETLPIHFIKIDVEGGEFDVLRGAKKIILRDKPVIIFEFGIGASDFYGTKPEDLFFYINDELNYKLSLLQDYYQKKPELKKEQFLEVYKKKTEYYFVAHS